MSETERQPRPGLAGPVAALAACVAIPATVEAAELMGSFPIAELRQYTLHPGKRDALIELFEREFVESQEAQGMKVIGTFIDLDRPDRFVWIRGFKDMDSRLTGLAEFYGGPVWKANREAANATMIDSDNVLLLDTFGTGGEFELPASRPALGEKAPAGLITATIYYLKSPSSDAADLFEKQIRPKIEAAGIQIVSTLMTKGRTNNFPRLPVREGERLLIWFAAFDDDNDRQVHQSGFDDAAEAVAPMLAREPEVLRLKPTSRSLIRGLPAYEWSDFDFLHGRWNVTHRRLKARGIGSNEWEEHQGTAVTEPLLDGLCNVEQHRIEEIGFAGMALRCFDRTVKQWRIYWVSNRDGILQPPVLGGFDHGVGKFQGIDLDGNRPVGVRFLWHKITPSSARWEQSFSYDGGQTWETNWTMDFQRAGH